MNLKIKLGLLAALVTAYTWRDTFDPESVRGKRVLVTGASMGIGEQMAYRYAELGAQIVITARSQNSLKKVVERCLELGAQKALYVMGDMSIPTDPERVLREATELLVSTTQCLHSALLLVASPGKMTTPFAGPYASTKFALGGFFGTMQHELAMQHSNVSVSIVTLGLIDTQTALDKIRGYTDVTPWPASEAALHIIKAGATRQTETYYPWFHWLTCFFRDWFPAQRDMMIRMSFRIPQN
ncbi:hydroxysteroid 11-beta-dehydrogenase 1-like protein [Engraulis encrasicolus]|uniref:hydroxysteroid 11-beta-dehydrogenase 1-like protein n=1 Tax=Engraulis encrasicolus TaxID=184585 RepID=UPI002FCE6E66